MPEIKVHSLVSILSRRSRKSRARNSIVVLDGIGMKNQVCPVRIYRRRSRRRKSAETGQQIIDAAYTLFYQIRFIRTGVDTIAVILSWAA
jgi:hypothetical protein